MQHLILDLGTSFPVPEFIARLSEKESMNHSAARMTYF